MRKTLWGDERTESFEWSKIGEDPPEPANDEASAVRPTTATDDPLADYPKLAAIAIVGAQRLRELAEQPVDWSWQDYVVAGTICVLAGPSSEGKTTLLFLLLLARATLGPPIEICGRTVKPAPAGQYIVLIEAEHGDSSASRKLVKSAKLLGIGDDGLDRIITIARKAVKLGSDEWKEIEDMIAAGLVSDVAIDTLARAGNGDANSEREQVENFEIIARAIEKGPVGSQPNAWVLAHTRKGAAEALDDVSGSAQRVGQADTVILVNGERNDQNQIVQSSVKLAKAREEPDTYPDVATIRIADGRVEWGSSAAKSKRGEFTPDQLAKVRSFVESMPSGHEFTVTAVAADAGVKKGCVSPCMRQLEADGLLVPRLGPEGDARGWDRA